MRWNVMLLVAVVVRLCGAASAADVEKGKAVYVARCAFCHGNAGRGDGPAGGALKPPPTSFASSDYWKSTSDQAVITAIKDGKPGTAMVPFGATLSAEELTGVLSYLKSFASD
jgi:mono/diheme cytochrome c family protein